MRQQMLTRPLKTLLLVPLWPLIWIAFTMPETACYDRAMEWLAWRNK
jgi:hypothetical protein